jgi:hypothetical protein
MTNILIPGTFLYSSGLACSGAVLFLSKIFQSSTKRLSVFFIYLIMSFFSGNPYLSTNEFLDFSCCDNFLATYSSLRALDSSGDTFLNKSSASLIEKLRSGKIYILASGNTFLYFSINSSTVSNRLI